MSRLKNLQEILKTRFNGRQRLLAQAIGKSAGQVSQWFTGHRPIGNAVARSIELALNLPQGWLDHGDAIHNVVEAPQGRLVPLISYVQAGGWVEIGGRNPDKMIHARESSPSENAFALIVEGESMVSETSPTFPEGTVIIVDPNRAPKAGDYVVARYGESATFKKLVTDGAMWFLRPLNRDYRPIEISHPEQVVVGVVIEYWTGGRL